MKGAMLYVNAGKGHYTPAVALAESFNNAGHDAIVEDLFTVVGAPFWEWFCKYDWRFLLHHPHLEGLSHRITDNRLSFYLIRWQGLSKKHLSNLYDWYIKHKPDFIVSTNFIGGIILPSALKKLGINIPVFQYAADVFDTPLSGINNDLTKMYLPTEIGCKNAIRKGQNKETVSICPFPLQSYIKNSPHITQQEARKKLGLKNKFTVLFALGGEGIEGNKSLDIQLETENVWDRTDEERELVSEHTTNYRLVEESYQEAKAHENDGELCNNMEIEDLDGKLNTKSHIPENGEIKEDYVELENGEKITFNELATKWGLYNDNGTPDADYAKQKFIEKSKENSKNETTNDEIIEQIDEEYNEDIRPTDSRNLG